MDLGGFELEPLYTLVEGVVQVEDFVLGPLGFRQTEVVDNGRPEGGWLTTETNQGRGGGRVRAGPWMG